MAQPLLMITIPETISDRLDKALAALIPKEVTLSRSRIQELIAGGAVICEGVAITNPKRKVQTGECYEIHLPEPKPLELLPEAIPLDIHYEDADLLVVNKPKGMVVHPGTGVSTGTLVNAVLAHCGDTLSGIGGVERPGIVHRIDKDTSGLLVIAKNDAAHQGLGAQFRAHSIHRRYLAFCYGVPSAGDPRILGLEGVSIENGKIRIDQPIGRHEQDRKRMSVRNLVHGKHAVTYLETLGQDATGTIAKTACTLETGRTHQIRVHMTYLGHPLLGDPVYGRGARQLPKNAQSLSDRVANLTGQALHAAELGFVHPTRGEELNFVAEMPSEMCALDDLIQS